MIEELKTSLPTQTTNNLTLPNRLSGYPNVAISWVSSNPAVISDDGQVFRPLYATGNKTIRLTATFIIKPDDALAQTFFTTFGISPLQESFTVKVICLPMTNEEKVTQALASLYVPSKTVSDIGLTTQLVEDDAMTITWSSANDTIISATGNVLGLGSTSLTATVTLGSTSEQKTFPIEVVSAYDDIVYTNPNLSEISSGTYANVWNSDNLAFNQAIIAEANNQKVVRMKANLQATITTLTLIENPASISLHYQIYATDANKLNKVSTLNIRYSQDQTLWTTVATETIVDGLAHQINLDLSAYHNVYLQIYTNSEYATDLRIDIRDIVIKRKIAAHDVQEWLNKEVVKKTSSSFNLLKTTAFGGSIVWNSAQPELISAMGKVTQPEETTKVSMRAEITGLPFAVSFQYDLQINGLNTVEPVEIYFIDLGKYGQSDSGESIYFRIGAYDVLVDAGDNYKTSNQAIKEVIDKYSEDRIIDLVIATHPDADHIGGMSFVFSEYQVLNLLQFHGTHTTQLYEKYVSSYQAEGLVKECLITDAMNNANGCSQIIEIAPSVTINLIETGYYETVEPNGRSIVFILEAYGTKVLLTGDADNNDGRTVEANYQQAVGDIDILKAVHHGTSHGSTLEFLKSSRPEVVIITNGNYFGNKHGHPTADAINRIYQANNQTQIYAVVGGDVLDCTVTASNSYQCNVTDRFLDRNGTINITIDNHGYEIQVEYFDMPLELSKTQFWKTHPLKEFEYGN